jgi:inner membrane protein
MSLPRFTIFRCRALDSLSQAALGAAVGYAVGGKRLGRAALAAGAIAGTIPDLDTYALLPFDAFALWTHHRGLSHSLFFGLVVGPALGWAVWRWKRLRRPFEPAGEEDALADWVKIFTFGLVTHPLLDWFTIYGTQLLAPFSNARFALPGLGIIDPGYTLPLLIGIGCVLARPQANWARLSVLAALAASTIYLFYGVSQNKAVETMAHAQLDREGVAVAQVRVFTTIFQPWLRRITVDEPDGVRVGYASPFQRDAIAWTCFVAPRDPAIDAVRATREGRILDWFADGHVWGIVAPGGDGTRIVRLTDRRYGVPGPTIQGWWGIEARVDANGRVVEAPVKIDLPRDVSRAGELFVAAWGRPTELFPHAKDAADAARACAANRIPA